MKRLLGIVLIILLWGCSKSVMQMHSIKGEPNTHTVFTNNLSDILVLPIYSKSMKTGDRFLLISFPGVLFELNNLSFTTIPGRELFSQPNEIDKAYLFSKMVNRIMLVDKGLSHDGSLLSDYYLKKIKDASPNSLPPAFVNKFPPKSLTSATYDDDFYLSVINPAQILSDSSWITIRKSMSQLDSLLIKKRHIQIKLPSYEFTASLHVLKLERPWFKLQHVIGQSGNQTEVRDQGKKIAYIDELIIAKRIRLDNYAGSKSTITLSKNKKEVKDISVLPASSIVSPQSLIIGYIYKLL